MAVCQVAVAWVVDLGGRVDGEDEVGDGERNTPRDRSDERSAENRSILSMPVIVDQPEISRALEMRKWVMLMAP